MEDAQSIILTVVVVVGFTALLTWHSFRKKAQSWGGLVTEIAGKQVCTNSLEEDEPATYESYVVIRYRTDEGKRGKLSLRKHAFDQLYSGLAVGDRLRKDSGEYMPVVERPAEAGGTAG